MAAVETQAPADIVAEHEDEDDKVREEDEDSEEEDPENKDGLSPLDGSRPDKSPYSHSQLTLVDELEDAATLPPTTDESEQLKRFIKAKRAHGEKLLDQARELYVDDLFETHLLQRYIAVESSVPKLQTLYNMILMLLQSHALVEEGTQGRASVIISPTRTCQLLNLFQLCWRHLVSEKIFANWTKSYEWYKDSTVVFAAFAARKDVALREPGVLGKTTKKSAIGLFLSDGTLKGLSMKSLQAYAAFLRANRTKGMTENEMARVEVLRKRRLMKQERPMTTYQQARQIVRAAKKNQKVDEQVQVILKDVGPPSPKEEATAPKEKGAKKRKVVPFACCYVDPDNCNWHSSGE